MTCEKLKGGLEAIGVPQHCYSLSGGLPNEAYCIDFVDDVWVVYYSKRGEKTGLREFQSEADACSYFLEIVQKSGLVDLS